MRVITSGFRYLDIDAFAGCVAYAELLQQQGFSAYAISSAPWNESVSQTVRSWGAPMLAKYAPDVKDTFTLIDISDPSYFDKFVDLGRVDEVIDHHTGFEQYWHERIGERARIEFIGAACTLVYERWEAAGRTDRMSPLSARLLVTGILDNTLNFGAHVTDNRDKTAYTALMQRADLPDTWPAQYFVECQMGILADIQRAVMNDVKPLAVTGFSAPVMAGQLAVWDGPQVLAQHAANIRAVLSATGSAWFMNLISIGDGTSYFICDDQATQAWLARLLGLKFENGLARAGRLWLRKEIIKQATSGAAR